MPLSLSRNCYVWVHLHAGSKTDEWIHFVFSPLLSVCLSLCSQSVVWCEKRRIQKLRREQRAQREGICTLADRKEKDGAEKLRSSWVSKKWTEKQENKAAPKYLHFLLPMFDILSVCMCVFFFSWSDWKGLGKSENIFVKRWQAHHWKMCMLPHFPSCFSLLLWFVLSSHNRNRHLHTFCGY